MKQKEKRMDDPVVAEVRKVRAELFAECGHDLHKLFARIRRQDQSHRRGSKAKLRRKAVAGSHE